MKRLKETESLSASWARAACDWSRSLQKNSPLDLNYCTWLYVACEQAHVGRAWARACARRKIETHFLGTSSPDSSPRIVQRALRRSNPWLKGEPARRLDFSRLTIDHLQNSSKFAVVLLIVTDDSVSVMTFIGLQSLRICILRISISVISVVAKVFVRIVYDQLYNFLSTEGIISDKQSGFQSLHSTVSALLEATDSWAFNIDRGCVNALVFLFLKKTFDTVYHEILLTKMNRYGIQGTSLDWFKSYLTNRAQRCSVNSCLSDFTTLKCGVPQGTILGPLLFLVYINDLPNCLSFSIPRMYADDTHITYAGSDLHLIQSSLSHALEKLSKWLVCNRLTLNATKTEFMVIGSRQRLSTLSDTQNSPLIMFQLNKFPLWNHLEYIFDENLTWHFHIDKLCKKIAAATGAIKRVKPFVPQSALLNI